VNTQTWVEQKALGYVFNLKNAANLRKT
jgi:hypothetical protein